MKLCIFGAGGFAKEVAWLANECGFDVAAFIDVKEKEDLLGIPVYTINYFDPQEHSAVIAVGSPDLRKKIVKNLSNTNTKFTTLIHPSVHVGLHSIIGRGSVICANSIITCNVNLGNFSQINLATTIGHDVTTGDFFTTAPQVAISGGCNIGSEVYFGTHSCALENLNICSRVVVGAAATITKDLVSAGTYIGTPAKLMLPSPALET